MCFLVFVKIFFKIADIFYSFVEILFLLFTLAFQNSTVNNTVSGEVHSGELMNNLESNNNNVGLSTPLNIEIVTQMPITNSMHHVSSANPAYPVVAAVTQIHDVIDSTAGDVREKAAEVPSIAPETNHQQLNSKSIELRHGKQLLKPKQSLSHRVGLGCIFL